MKWIPLAAVLVLAGCQKEDPPKGPDQGAQPKEMMSIDPVCGMEVSGEGAGKATHDGKDYFFCNAGCKEKFEKDPKAFLKEGTKGPVGEPLLPKPPECAKPSCGGCPTEP
jgi:Cu+-exporting ATPase